MANAPALVRIFLTPGCLDTGEIREAWAEISGDVAIAHFGLSRCGYEGEGTRWHRTRWAAESYARQCQAARLDHLRAELIRLEGYRFGRLGP